MACRFQVLTWFGWTSCRAAISCTVRSPRNASSATRFLKSAVNRPRLSGDSEAPKHWGPSVTAVNRHHAYDPEKHEARQT